MQSYEFNNLMPNTHHKWAAEVLNMQSNSRGPDLIDKNKFIEIKFTLFPNSKNYVKWNVHEYQMKYPENQKTPYWGLGIYALKKPILDIETKNPEELEKLVISRELYIVEWAWMNQFKPYPSFGKTEISSWNNIVRYPKLKKLPPKIKQFKVEKGKLYLTQGISEKDFQIN